MRATYRHARHTQTRAHSRTYEPCSLSQVRVNYSRDLTYFAVLIRGKPGGHKGEVEEVYR